MMKTAAKITDAELVVMDALWQEPRPVTLAQLRGVLLQTTKWNGDTIKTLLRRLCEKGAVAQEKREVYYYSPLASAETYEKYSTQTLIDRLYAGSAKNLVAGLVKNRQLRAADIDELRALLEAGDFDG